MKKFPFAEGPAHQVDVAPAGDLREELEEEMKNLKNLQQKVQRFLASEDGPTAVEYAVMLALIVIVCLTAIRSIGTQASGTFQNVADQLAPAP